MSRHCDECKRVLTGSRKRFCSNRCKDIWHNWNNPRGKFAHLTRLTPEERARFEKERDDAETHETAMEAQEFGWDGHKS